ncbi:MAG: DUF5671 domain-containing protein [Acidimicrobiia bacterium]
MIAIAGLIPLAILGGLIAGIAALAKRNDEEPPDGLVGRVVFAALTFGLTAVTAVGLYMLLNILIGEGGNLARSGSSDIAQGLALTLVGAPATYFLWRHQLKSLAGPDGRSIVWLLHQAIASLTFSIGTVIAFGYGLRFHDFDGDARSALAFGLAWLAGWLLYEWIRSIRPAPMLAGLPHAIGGGVGLVTVAFGSVTLIGSLIDLIETDVVATSGRTDPVFASIVWTMVGAVVWAWQFLMRPAYDDPSRAGLVLGLGVGGGALMGLTGLTALLALALFAITGDFETDGLGEAIGAIGVGFLIWRFHRGLASDPREARIARHLVAGLSLIGVAIGIGVLVNAALAALTPAFASSNEDELLWGGLASLIANGPVWWWAWRPGVRPDPDYGTTVQRTYLTVLGGVAAVSGAIALIYLLFQLLEGLFDGNSLSAIVDGIRAPLGFVVATGSVTAYHYRRWASSRDDAPDEERVTVERVTFVGADGKVAADLTDELGVRTTRWSSAGEGRVLESGELTSYLRSLDATDVLVVEEERGFRVIRLLRDNDQRPHTGEPQE